MTDPVFQAPGIPTPPVNDPKAEPTQPVSSVPSQPVAQPQPVANETVPPAQSAQQQPVENTPASSVNNLKAKLAKIDVQQLREKIQSYLWYVLGGCFILGMMFGCSMGGGESKPVQQKTSGMERYIVANSDIPKKVRICGMSNLQTESCRYYVLNSYSYDKRAEDFFKLVQDQVKKDEYYIRQVNPIYAQQIIHPGYFAEILVPATK